MPLARLVGVVLSFVLLAGAQAGAADWMRLRSRNFTLEGDVGAAELTAVARQLEQFREVLARALPDVKLVTPAPLTVVLFAHTSDMKAIALRFEGKPIDLAGFATTSPIGPSIVLSVERRDRAFRVAYHEYTHLVVSNAMLSLPTWVSEGLAEFYGTFEISEDGRRAVLGRPVSDDEILLLRDGLLPMSEFLRVDEGSKVYNVGADRDLFYAQSWALVHYLLLGNPERGRQFRDYLSRLASGTPADAAFTAAFPQPEKIAGELSSYVKQSTMRAIGRTFDDRVGSAADFTLAPMTPAEARATLALELVRQRRFDEARVALEWALAHAPETASALTASGLSDLLQGRVTEGVRALRKGAELADGDAMAHYAYGFGAVQCLTSDCLREMGGREVARREFQRAVDLQPRFPDALAGLGWAEAATGGNLATAELHYLQAIDLQPGREDYRLNLAQIYLRQENVAKTQALLGPLAASSPRPEVKARAREMLGELAAIRARREALAAESAAAAAALAASGGAPASRPADQPAAGAGSTASVVIPVYRQLGPGESEAEGLLESILCPTGGSIIVVVRHDKGARRFSSARLDGIDFITYRDDLAGSVTCGPQRAGLRVRVSFRQPAAGEAALPAGIEGRVVAIEFLPKEKEK
jgi:tetratricopeptide (TPR) repeat protein